MLLVPRYPYRTIDRVTHPDGTRYYICPDSGQHLPSVTTILDATENKTKLNEWRARIGDAKADRERTEATGLGSLMHLHLECHLQGLDRPGGNNTVRKMAARMADQIIGHGLPGLEEVWGIEVALHFPGLYAGTTDLVGLYEGTPAILDHKTSKKLKKPEEIEHYFAQGCAYCLSHNHMFGTDIGKVVIFMASRDGQFRRFVIEGENFDRYCALWFERFTAYEDSRNRATPG